MISLPARRSLGFVSGFGIAALTAFALIGEYGRRQLTRSNRTDFRDEPDRWGLTATEELTIRSRDGLAIHAWLFRAPRASPTVIGCHGHGGNKHTMLPVAQFLQPEFNVLLLDSRGHGESGGRRTTVGYEERLDVQAAVDELE